MALRHSYPAGAEGLQVGRELEVVAVMRPPKLVSFRAGANMKSVVDEMGTAQSVVLDAAVGAGKSTRFPRVYAKVSRSLTFHVVPNPLLALDLFNYANKSEEFAGLPCELMREVDQEVPRTGVLYMASAMLVAIMIRHKSLRVFGDVTVFLDEAHESDCYTHVVRNTSIQRGAMRLIQASATMTPGESRSRETPGQVLEKTYDPDSSPAEWDVCESGKPWSAYDFTDNCVIFLDSYTQSKRLVAQYRGAGLTAFRLCSGMSEAEFLDAMSASRDKRGSLVVLVADYSFRSGFSFDANRCIDTGTVAFTDPTPGKVQMLNRKMYRNESVQASGRLGRVGSAVATYWRPRDELKSRICDLEGVEKEAAAYLYRCLGWQPNGILADAIMARSVIRPGVSPVSALNGSHPLTAYAAADTGEQVQTNAPSGRDVRAGTPRSEREGLRPVGRDGDRTYVPSARDTRTSFPRSERERLGSMGRDGSPVGDPRPKYEELKHVDGGDSPTARRFSQATTAVSDGGRTNAPNSGGSVVAHFDKLMADVPEQFRDGQCYWVSEVDKEGVSSAVFPRGLASVRRLLSSTDGDLAVAGLRKADRKNAVALVLDRYNLLNVEVTAIERTLGSLADMKGSSAAGYAAREFVTAMFERRGAGLAERLELLSCLEMLVHRHYLALPMNLPTELVDQSVSKFMFAYTATLHKHKTDAGEYTNRLRELSESRWKDEKQIVKTTYEVLPKHVSEYKLGKSSQLRLLDRQKFVVLDSKHKSGTVASVEKRNGRLSMVVR